VIGRTLKAHGTSRPSALATSVSASISVMWP
jgi:hypothetical protein